MQLQNSSQPTICAAYNDHSFTFLVLLFQNFLLFSRALRHESFVCAGIAGSTNVEDVRTGLVSAHAYALLRAVRVRNVNFYDLKYWANIDI